ncbi:hypothetical protein V8F20_010933, partial [Naviculisporaceae sp. PSN 640]
TESLTADVFDHGHERILNERNNSVRLESWYGRRRREKERNSSDWSATASSRQAGQRDLRMNWSVGEDHTSHAHSPDPNQQHGKMRESALNLRIHWDTLGWYRWVSVGRWRVTSDSLQSLPGLPKVPPCVPAIACPSILRRKEETTGQDPHHGWVPWGNSWKEWSVRSSGEGGRWMVSQVATASDWTAGQGRNGVCLGSPCCTSSQDDSNENGS